MKKIGIVTLYETNNYGTILQCFALKKVIKSLTKEDVSVLFHEDMVDIQNGFSGKELSAAYQERIDKFSELRNLIGIDASERGDFDYYIVGSDTVWWTNVVGNEDIYFLTFVQKGRKIAYAPSLGTSKFDLLNADAFRDNIPKFDFLSVREADAKEYLRNYTNAHIEEVLDPTLLLNSDEYEQIEIAPLVDEKYILLYLIYDDSANNSYLINIANRLAQKHKMKVVHFVYNIPDYIFGENENSFAFAGPREFLGYVHHAEMIITNSYHGTIFSIVYRKPFYSAIWDEKRSKISQLCNKIGLSNRIIKPTINLNEYHFDIDYSEVSLKLEECKKRSMDFLMTVLDVKR